MEEKVNRKQRRKIVKIHGGFNKQLKRLSLHTKDNFDKFYAKQLEKLTTK